jgi:hypothetical protein
MTPKTLFSIILKVFGLFFLKDIFGIVTQLLPTVIYLAKPEMASGAIVTIVIYLLYILVYLLIAYYLIARSDTIIEKLKLDKDFDQEPFQFNMHRSALLSICLVVIGGLLITEGIPTFLGQLYSYFKSSGDRYSQSDPTVSYLLITGSRILTGFLVIAEKKWIINFIERKRQA